MIKFVYFDVGGTVIKDFSGTDNWQKLKEEIGIKQKDQQKFSEYWDSLDKKININLDIELIKPEIEKEFGVKFPSGYSLLIDGFVKKFFKNESILPVIIKIQRSVPIGLLTNMYPYMFDAIKERNLLPVIDWNYIVDSSKVGLAKPDPKIYELAEKLCGVRHDEILLIDNGVENIENAKQFGWQTFLYDPKDPVLSSKNLLEYFHSLNEK